MDVLVLKYETITNKPQVSYKEYLHVMHDVFPSFDSSSNDVVLNGMSKYLFIFLVETI